MDGHILQTVVVLSLGVGIFLRLVAKEKHRRERHLQFRLEEQVRKIEARKERARMEMDGNRANQAGEGQ